MQRSSAESALQKNSKQHRGLSVFVTGDLFLTLEKTQRAYYIYTCLIYVYMVKTLLGLFDNTSNCFNTDLLTVSGKSTPK